MTTSKYFVSRLTYFSWECSFTNFSPRLFLGTLSKRSYKEEKILGTILLADRDIGFNNASLKREQIIVHFLYVLEANLIVYIVI